MRKGTVQRHPAAPTPFTLVEMLVVIAVIAILLAVANPVFDKLTVGTGVDAAERMVTTKLQLCRQYAIGKREKVALVMPGATGAANNKDITFSYRYTSMRPAIVSGTSSPFTFVRWVENTSWDTMPAGTAINEADADPGAGTPPVDESFSTVTITNTDMGPLGPTVDAGSQAYRCLVFSPSGRVLGSSRYVTVSDTTYAPSGASGTWIDRPGDNEFTVVVNQYTGRTLVKQKSEY